MNPAFGVQQTAEAIASGEHNVYNTETGTIVVADIVSGDHDDTEYDGGFRAGNGEWIHGVMYTKIRPEDRCSILETYDTLGDYVLAEIPAPGTCAPGRLQFVPADSPEDIKEFFTGLFEKEPDGWRQE